VCYPARRLAPIRRIKESNLNGRTAIPRASLDHDRKLRERTPQKCRRIPGGRDRLGQKTSKSRVRRERRQRAADVSTIISANHARRRAFSAWSNGVDRRKISCPRLPISIRAAKEFYRALRRRAKQSQGLLANCLCDCGGLKVFAGFLGQSLSESVGFRGL